MENAGENLRKVRKNRNITTRIFGDLMGVSAMTVSRWETGKVTMHLEDVMKAAEILDVKPETLLQEADSFQDEEVQATEKYVDIPIVGNIACSFKKGFIPDSGEYVSIDSRLKEKYEFVSAVRARGMSMSPEIQPGDTMIVVPITEQPQNNDIVIATVCDDELTAKKFFRNDKGGFDLVPVNEAFGPMSFTPEQIQSFPVNITGLVVEVRRCYRK